LKKVFEKDKQVQVFFTRTEDRFVPLEDRAALAQRVGADVFISLHANSGPPSARGFEVWYLSSKGSRREAHRLLRGGRKSASVDLIQRIIVDKQREGTQNKSSLLAGFLNQSLSTTGQKSRGARAENFAVLRSVAVPSILIELGFLSDKREEARLMTAKFQTQQAEAIRDGVLAYLRSQGLLGSEMPARTLYAVRKNDSLSEISQRFGIELVDLAMANGLGKASPLYVGQLLEIPNDPVGALIGAHIE
jgi:N-acetylmuramoyl-L-alanine amidase